MQRSVLEAVRGRSIPVASRCHDLADPTPTVLVGDTLTVEFPADADFHRRQIAEPQSIGLLRDALYEVTGRKANGAGELVSITVDPKAIDPEVRNFSPILCSQRSTRRSDRRAG